MPIPETTPKKSTTPRKRKGTADDEDGADAEATPKKARGRPKKKAVTPEVDGNDDEVMDADSKVKKEEVVEDAE